MLTTTHQAPLCSCPSQVIRSRVGTCPTQCSPFFRADSTTNRIFHRGSLLVRICPPCLADTRAWGATLGRRFQGKRRFGGPHVATVVRTRWQSHINEQRLVGHRLDSQFTSTVLDLFEILFGNAWLCNGTIVLIVLSRSAIGTYWIARRDHFVRWPLRVAISPCKQRDRNDTLGFLVARTDHHCFEK
jgi:hypothetical protein